MDDLSVISVNNKEDINRHFKEKGVADISVKNKIRSVYSFNLLKRGMKPLVPAVCSIDEREVG